MPASVCRVNKVDIVDIRQSDLEFSLVDDIHASLNPGDGKARSLPTILLYDTKGLNLFEQITYLEEYYLTNAEIEVLTVHARKIVERIPENAQLLELGSGNLRKIEILLKEFETVEKRVDYYALDLSLSELQRTFSEISVDHFSFVGFHGLHGTYDDALAWLGRSASRARPTVVMSLGSSLGNFDRPEAASFLRGFAAQLGQSDLMIIGLDACKNPEKVYRAYNDDKGVTRQFYENGLAHANTILGYEAFNPSEWAIVTQFDEKGGRHQAFFSPNVDVTVGSTLIRQGEKVIFEEAIKYGPEERDLLWRRAGLISAAQFSNATDEYHLHILSPAVLELPSKASQYASRAVPTVQDFRSLWTAWDVVTRGMVPAKELLSKPINLRNALIFYLGHIPTFADIHLSRALRAKPTEPKSFQLIFERGIDPDVDNPDQCHPHSEIPSEWPSLDDILQYQQKVRGRIHDVLQLDLVQDRTLAEALWIAFEHEAMHLETFLYMLAQSDKTMPPPGIDIPDFEKMHKMAREQSTPNEWFSIPQQMISIGIDDRDCSKIPNKSFGWDNEKPRRTLTVPAFEAQARAVTNGEYAEFLQANQLDKRPASWLRAHEHMNGSENGHINGNALANGIRDQNGADSHNGDGNHNGVDNPNGQTISLDEFLSQYFIKTVFGAVSLKLARDWPIMASYDELAEYAKWRHCRIPTFEEVKSIYKHADILKRKANRVTGHGNGPNGVNGANGTNGPSNELNGTTSADHGAVNAQPVFIDLDDCNVGFRHWHPVPVVQDGSRLAGRSELGGVWEWTSTPLAPHDGFEAMNIYPGYTSDFFDGKHNIILGGSWATHPRIAGRTTFVNWYQRNYPFTWAGARLVRDL